MVIVMVHIGADPVGRAGKSPLPLPYLWTAGDSARLSLGTVRDWLSRALSAVTESTSVLRTLSPDQRTVTGRFLVYCIRPHGTSTRYEI